MTDELHEPLRWQRIDYTELSSRSQENFNYAKASAILADFGYATVRLSDDVEGADFLAIHVETLKVLKVQLKGRLQFKKAYEGKDLYVAFFDRTAEGEELYLYPHDVLCKNAEHIFGASISWSVRGGYSRGRLSKELKNLLTSYRVSDLNPDDPQRNAPGGGG